ncbi:MAG: hypothetical protein HN509_08225 [Halobacteriovoraceae bacterium]|jgi:hypothetical protein|nr:hypothetical protein [Halobacteriovoraceae bacterium]MBT5095555.1 hypothetical protein [Halobacteriovoraceae bacterium]
MKTEITNKTVKEMSIIKKCHVCGTLSESAREPKKCKKCKKSFLPLNYFGKVHAKDSEAFNNLFSKSEELHDDDLIKGIHVLW